MPAKIYERHWTQANSNSLSFPSSASGDSKCFALNFPHECVIQKIICTQVAGTVDEGYSLTIFNLPTSGIGASEAHGEATGVQKSVSIGKDSDSILGKCGNTLVAGIGSGYANTADNYKTIQWHAMDDNVGGGMYFRNMEGTQTNPKRRIFVQIDVTAGTASARIWELAITCTPAAPN